MRRNRTAHIIGSIIMVAAGVFLVASVAGALLAGTGSLGMSWGTGWRGWLVIPLLISGVLGALSLFVFGAVVYFVGEISNNTRAARERGPIVPKKVAKPAAAEVTVIPDASLTPPAPAVLPLSAPVIDREMRDVAGETPAAPVAPEVDWPFAAPETTAVEHDATAGADLPHVEIEDLSAAAAVPSAGTEISANAVEAAPVMTSDEFANDEVVTATPMELDEVVAGTPGALDAGTVAALPEAHVAAQSVDHSALEAAFADEELDFPTTVPNPDRVIEAERTVMEAELPLIVPEIPDELADLEPGAPLEETAPVAAVLPELELPADRVADVEPFAELPVTDAVASLPELELPAERLPDVEPSVEVPVVDAADSLPEMELPKVDLESPQVAIEEALEAPAAPYEASAEEALPQFEGPTVPSVATFSLDESEVSAPVADEVDLARIDMGVPDAETVESRLETELEGPALEAEVTRVDLPEVELPEVDLPEAELPEVELPEAELPEVELPEVNLPEAELPEVELPEVRGIEQQAMDEPDVALLAATEATLPTVDLTAPEAPPPFTVEAPVAAEPPATPPAQQDEVASLRALVAELSARLARIEGSAPAQPPVSPAPPAPQVPPAPAAAPAAAEPTRETGAPNRLPGADAAARIAAEMAAAVPPRRRAPRAPQQGAADEQRAPGDDFSLITGVGPTYAQRLREKGITTYTQLADASYEVLDEVTNGNLERVLRQDWRGQARRFAQRARDE